MRASLSSSNSVLSDVNNHQQNYDTADYENQSRNQQSAKRKRNEPDKNWVSSSAEPPDFPFTAKPGLKIDVHVNSDLLFLLDLLLTEDLLKFMVDKTNAYATKVISETTVRRNSRYKHWKPTDCAEMRVFIGMMLNMGVVNLAKVPDHWSTDPFLKTNFSRNVMPRDRFKLLLQFWHFEDEASPESSLHKILPLMDHFNNTMSSIYCPGKD